MSNNGIQSELFLFGGKLLHHPFRLHVNDCVMIDGKLGRVIRVSECAAVVLVNRPAREFTTRFDRRVQFRQSPITVRIAANSDVEILNRKTCKRNKRKQREQGGRP